MHLHVANRQGSKSGMYKSYYMNHPYGEIYMRPNTTLSVYGGVNTCSGQLLRVFGDG